MVQAQRQSQAIAFRLGGPAARAEEPEHLLLTGVAPESLTIGVVRHRPRVLFPMWATTSTVFAT